MAHHSSDSESILGLLRGHLGATGQFPEGKLTKTDEGEIKIAVISKDGKIVIHFGKPTAWIGFTPAQALEIAELLQKHAASAA